MTSNIILFCVVDGDAHSRAFSVEIDPTKTVDHLKKLIKAEKTNDFSDIDADKLTLWKVSISDDGDDDERLILFDRVSEKKKLKTTTKLSKVFDAELPEDTIHILVRRPPPVNADVLFKINIKDESLEPLQWRVNPSTVTLAQLQSSIEIALPNLHHERQKIAIEHIECSSFPKGGIVYPSSDNQLQEIFKTYVRAGLVTMTVHVGFLRKGFSLFSVSDIAARLGTNKFEEMEVGRVDCSHGRHLEALEKLWITIGLARDSIGAWSEASTTRFSGSFFMAATTIFPNLHLIPEKPITGSWGNGPVDYLIETKNALEVSMVGVAEAKKQSTFKAGHAQNIAQLEATLTSRMDHDCRCNGKSMDLFSYGIVTDANRWEFIECRMDAASINGLNRGIVVRKTKLEITIDYNDDERWKDQVKVVFEHVVWMFEKMSGS
ncbi:hypothetical protein BGZ82_008617, partial [Podila clonocystis]